MRLLHTSDWHVGKTVRGRSRADEHIAVLAEIAHVANAEQVDAVLVVGDVFDTAAPAPESERIVYRALLDLSHGGSRPVIVVSGNHDNPRRLGAVSPVFGLANVHVATSVRAPADGGVLELALDATGEKLRVALMPFVSQRHVVHAADLMRLDATETGGHYADRLRRIIAALTAGFHDDAVNIVMAHLMVTGGMLGGGERSAHTVFDYWVAPQSFPTTAHYVALGHLHRPQRVEGPCPTWYSGSPLAMDFGEEADRKAVLVIDAAPGRPASVTEVPLRAGRRFRTVEGTLAELRTTAAAEPVLGDPGADEDVRDGSVCAPYIRCIVHEKPRLGLAEEVRALFPAAVDIQVRQPGVVGSRHQRQGGSGSSPHELFEAYLRDRDAHEPQLIDLFDELLEELSAGDAEQEGTRAT